MSVYTLVSDQSVDKVGGDHSQVRVPYGLPEDEDSNWLGRRNQALLEQYKPGDGEFYGKVTAPMGVDTDRREREKLEYYHQQYKSGKIDEETLHHRAAYEVGPSKIMEGIGTLLTGPAPRATAAVGEVMNFGGSTVDSMAEEYEHRDFYKKSRIKPPARPTGKQMIREGLEGKVKGKVQDNIIQGWGKSRMK